MTVELTDRAERIGSAPEPESVRDPRLARVRSMVALLWAPTALYVAIRAFQLGILKWLLFPGHPGEAGTRAHLLEWDSVWFVRVAQSGYPHSVYWPNGWVPQSAIPFFPLYPALIRVTHEVTRLPYDLSAYGVSFAAAGAAAVLLFLLGRDMYDDRTGYALLVLFAAQPAGIVLSMAYSEALFTALAVAMLYALRRGLWLTAGVFCLLAGLTRVTGLAASAALGLTALYTLWKMWKRSRGAGLGDEKGAIWDRPVAWWRPVLATVIGAAGVPGFMLWIGLRVGRLDAYFVVQRVAWNTKFDGGWQFVHIAYRLLRGSAYWTPGADPNWSELNLTLLLLAAIGLTVIAAFERTWMPLVVYGALILAMNLSSDGIYSVKFRYLVPVVVILVPIAVALARAKRRTAVLLLIGYAIVGTWYGAHELVLLPMIM